MGERLKRRLVGGAVLVLLAVIFLPMLFEDALKRPSTLEALPEPPAPGELPAVSVVPSAPKLPLASAWAVQVGSFAQADNAARLEARLRGAGFPAFVDTVTGPEEALYRVRVGPVLDKNEAAKLAERIRERFGLKGFVVPHSQ